MAFNTVNFRAGTLYLQEETNPNVLQKPTNGDQALAIQSDIAIDPAQESLTSDELKSNLMASKSCLLYTSDAADE